MRTSISAERSVRPPTDIWIRTRDWLARLLARLNEDERAATRMVWGAWTLTRLLLFAGLILGKNYCDPEFYEYAGKLSVGQLPYVHVPVEYPPLAMLLILLPALALLPFSSVAPRLDPAFQSLVRLPQPHDMFRYGAYGVSFGVEMLLIDAATLWLVRWAARRLLPGDAQGAKSGLLYVLLVFASGALLQKFDLAAGTLCLLAIVALVDERRVLAWGAVGAAALVKGYPLLIVPALIAYELCRAPRGPLWHALLRRKDALLRGVVALVVVIAIPTLLVVAMGGISAVTHTLQVQGVRGAEIESVYANGLLLLGWIPGLAVRTSFAPGGLSRVISTPSTDWVALANPIVLTALLALVCVALARAALRMRRSGRSGRLDAVCLAGVGGTAALLAFMLAFRALPAHYLLVILPLAAVIRLRQRRFERLWIGGIVAVMVLGQVIATLSVWHALVALLPWAVLLLTLRNITWILASGTLIVALWQWSDPLLRTGSWGTRHEGRRTPRRTAGAARRRKA